MSSSSVEKQTHTLSTPDGDIVYDVRGAAPTQNPPTQNPSTQQSDHPALLLIGTPMDAVGFTTLAGHFTDRPVITYDPRNVGRSRRSDSDHTPTPEDHAADLHALITELGETHGITAPVDLFGSSGGAINALALISAHPEDVRVLVAHEPPAGGVLPDAEHLRAASIDVHDTYQRSGFGPAMAKFITLISAQGPIGEDYAQRPDPDPAMFGLPTDDDGGRADPMMHNMLTIPVWAPDLDAVREASTRVVLGIGAESGQTMAARAPQVIAQRTGREAVVFPSDHGGFLGGEYGQTGQPDAFAATLREVLDS